MYGAPGACKSSLLAHLRTRWATMGDSAPLALLASVSSYRQDSESLALGIVEVADPKTYAELRQTKSTGTDSGIGVNVSIVGGDHRQQQFVSEASTLAFCVMRALMWRRPPALLIDEVQDLDAHEFKLLRDYHTGARGCPIVPVSEIPAMLRNETGSPA